MNKTKYLIVSTIISVFSMVILGFLTFIRTKIVLVYCGDALNAILQLSNQILTYVVLLESGICGAYKYKMYKPLASSNFNKVSSLFSGLSKSLNKIAVKMLIIITIISVVYPLVINREKLPYFQTILILFILGIRFVLPYFLYVSKKNMFLVVQKRHIMDIIEFVEKGGTIILEIFLISVLHVRIELALLVGIFVILGVNLLYSHYLNKHCSYLYNKYDKPMYEGDKLTKVIIVHQISDLVFNSTDMILLSIFNSLTSVNIYSAFSTLITYPTTIFEKMAVTLTSVFGIKLAKNEKNSFDIFNQLMSVVYFIGIIITATFYVMACKFVTIWIGDKYTITIIPLILFTIFLASKIFMPIFIMIRNSMGLYEETKKATINQTVLNIIISIILVKPFGITGVLIGSIVSTYLIYQPVTFHYVYKKVFNKKMSFAYKQLLVLTIGIILSIMCSQYAISLLNYNSVTFVSFIFETLITTIISTIIAGLLLLFTSKYFRDALKKIRLKFE